MSDKTVGLILFIGFFSLPMYLLINGAILEYKVNKQKLAWEEADREVQEIVEYYREYTPEKLEELRREERNLR